jgi:hypothetical protein
MASIKLNEKYLAIISRNEIRGTYRGMMIAIPPQKWQVFNQMNLIDLTKILIDLATHLDR